MMPKKEEKSRKKLVVEEVAAPVDDEMVSSTNLEKEEIKENKPEILEEAASTEVAESPSEEMEKEIHEEESHLHDIHTGAAAAAAAPVVPSGVQPIERRQGNPILWILIPGIFLLGALLGGIVFYQKGISTGETQTPSPSPVAVATSTPNPTTLPKADLTKYPIKVQNGSGIPGAAGDVKDILTKAGFKVSGTGNAPTYDYTKTIIETKSDVPQAFIDQLSSTLSGTYVLGTPVTLKDSSTDEVIVIVGSTKAQ